LAVLIASKQIMMVPELVIVTANVLEIMVERATDREARSFVKTNLKMVRRTRLEAHARATRVTSDASILTPS
jgi:hypothetical protein